MPLPPAELLFEHLLLLRDAEDPTHPRHDKSWREVSRWLALAHPSRTQDAEDARQEAMASLIRYIGGMRAESPVQAAKWLMTIVRRKHVDVARASARDPVTKALRAEPRGPDATPLLDRIASDPQSRDGAPALARVVNLALEHVQAFLEETVRNPGKRLLRAAQARATLLRLVYEQDAEAIVEALDYGEPIPKDRLYKWVERGRPTVLAALDRWEGSLQDEGDGETMLPVIEALRELVGKRRADAGQPRPGRRRGGAVEE